jgi:lipopolysaccharide export system ATP-binding protein
VPPGRITALIGPNGAGKSTLFKVLMGLIRPDAGHAAMDSENILSSPLHERAKLGLGYLPQESASFPDLSVRDNLRALLELLPMDRDARKSRLGQLLEVTGLLPVSGRAARWLSGGENRRLEIAKALATTPRILLLDEPFSGLDPGIVEEIIQLLADLAARRVGILLSDHNIHMTLNFADHVYLMVFGKVVCSGSPEEIMASDLARKSYLGEHFSA